MKACHGKNGVSQQYGVLNSHFGGYKMGAVVLGIWHFPYIFICFTGIINYCDVFQFVNTFELQKGNETQHPMPAPFKVCSQIGIDVIYTLTEIEGYQYIVTTVDNTIKSVEAESLKEKTVEPVEKFSTNYYVYI